jgi:hypothetical protein
VACLIMLAAGSENQEARSEEQEMEFHLEEV